jgi:cyclic pyranopterin phosphate synthase
MFGAQLAMTFPTFSHLDADGQAQMVDVGGKTTTDRVAIAKSRLKAKGDVLNVARIAGIQAAKQTSLLIPLCHLLPLDQVALRSEWLAPDELEWTAEVRCSGKTGVEMEALVAASVAALTVYDMAKALDRSMHVTHVGLWHKAGGAGGRYARDEKLHSSESRDDD